MIDPRPSLRFATAFTVLTACLAPASAQIISANPVSPTAMAQSPYSSVGVTETQVGPDIFRGSASVARDERLILTCAHIAFDRGRWAESIRFARAWNARNEPPGTAYTTLRGYRYFASYADNVARDRDNTLAFVSDFVVGFHTASLGPALPAAVNGVPALSSSGFQKIILGYPAERDPDSRPGFYFLHQTGPFSGGLLQESGSYFGLAGVTTGPGNSGGPVLDFSAGSPVVSGILVSGSPSSIGVYVLGAEAQSLIANALASIDTSGSPVSPGSDAPGRSTADQERAELQKSLQRLADRLVRVRRIQNPSVRIVQIRRIQLSIIAVIRQLEALDKSP